MNLSFFVLLGLFTFTIFLRVVELFIAKRNKQLNLQKEGYSYYKEPYYFVFVILHSSFLVITPLEVYFLKREFHLVLGLVAISIYFFCILLRLHIFFILKEKWNTELIYSESQDAIVTKGIYAYIRHPNYLVVILEIFSLSLFHSAWVSLIVFSIANLVLLLNFRIPLEEKLLFQNPSYKLHFQNKGRFFPKF